MDPSEITVVVYQAHGLSTKKRTKHKYNVTFGVNNNRAKSDNVDQAEGSPEWNTEAEIKVDNHLDPLILKVKDKDDILGQITLHMHELPNSKPTRPKKIPLQPHKKAPNPQGEVVFCAWISAHGETKSTIKGTPSPVNGLAAQKAQMMSSNIHGSQESLNSTISGFSTMSETTKKKSTLKKLKGVFKKSPMLGGSNLASKNSSQSCMDLSAGQSNLTTIKNINLHGSRESLSSQVSEASNLSALSGSAKKKSKNPFKKLKEKATGSKMSKSNSQSMHNLAFGNSGMSLSPGAPHHHGSSESLEKLDKSSMDKNFPNKFDLTVPKTLISTPITGEGDANQKMDEIDETAEFPALAQVKGHRRIGSDTSSIHSTGSNKQIVTPEPMQRRRLSYQARSLRDDPRERPKPSKSSPQPSPVSTPVSRRQGSTRSESDSTSATARDDAGGHHRSLCMPKDEPAVHQRSPTIGSSKEDVRASKSSLNKEKGISETLGGDKQSETSSEDSLRFHSEQSPVFATLPTSPKSSTPKSSIVPAALTTKTPPQIADNNLPEISGVSPSECSIEGGTVITLRGSNLGQDKADIVWLSVCGANCLGSLVYISSHKLCFTAKAWKPGSGKIVIETQSGGRSHSLVDFTYVDNNVSVDEEVSLEIAAPVSPKQVTAKAPESPVKPKRSFNVESDPDKVKDNPRGHTDSEKQDTEEQEVKDPRKQKREDPEGMPMAKQENGDNVDKLSSLTKATSKTTVPQKVSETESKGHHVSQERTTSPRHVFEGPSQKELLEMVKKLQGENQALKEDNTQMKGYIDRIINKVIDRCPDVLCVDMSA